MFPLGNINIGSGFWGARQATNRNRTLPAIYHQMKQTGRLDAWRLDWQPGRPKPHIFWDSDTGKWIEAVSYSLMNYPDPGLEAQVDEVVDLIEKAQQPDGYLNVFFTAVEPQNRWRNLRDKHELYDAGHLLEGALAYHQATGKRKFLDVLVRYMDHIDQRFGSKEGQIRGYCGHPEIELALVKLYHATDEKRYLDLSGYFIEERGQSPHYFDLEANRRGDDPQQYWAKSYHYCQAHMPVRQQNTAAGHAVRAGYLFSAVADIAAENDDAQLREVCRLVWDDLTEHSLYITGGLGPARTNEGFTFHYDLPNETAYAETCASVALVFWAYRMFEIDPHNRYTDVMERVLYNGMLSGVSYEGSHFFYANPLASYPNISPCEDWSGIRTQRYYRRSEWFECACCPPNLARLVASVGRYFYSVKHDRVYVHLYNDSHARLEVNNRRVQIQQQTNYPWESTVVLTIQLGQPQELEIALRIPGWCRDFDLEVNGAPFSAYPINGYVPIRRRWANNDEINLSLQMPIERMASHSAVRQNAGCIALQRGPLVYCLEEVDNRAHLANVIIPRQAQLRAIGDANLFGGIHVITGDAICREPHDWHGGLYQAQSAFSYAQSTFEFRAIPYCFWANRDPGEMRVWMRET